MSEFLFKVRKFWLDGVFIGLPGAGAIACWVYELPLWMFVICLLAVIFAVISLLGDLGLFGGDRD